MCLRIAPSNAVRVTAYDSIKEALMRRDPNREGLTTVERLLAGVVAKM